MEVGWISFEQRGDQCHVRNKFIEPGVVESLKRWTERKIRSTVQLYSTGTETRREEEADKLDAWTRSK